MSPARSADGVTHQARGAQAGIRWTRYGPGDGSFRSAASMTSRASGRESKIAWGTVTTYRALARARSAVVTAIARAPAQPGRDRTSPIATRPSPNTVDACASAVTIAANPPGGSNGPKIELRLAARNAARMAGRFAYAQAMQREARGEGRGEQDDRAASTPVRQGVPAEPREGGAGQHGEDQEFRREPEQAESRQDLGQPPVEAPVAVAEMAVHPDRLDVGRIERAERPGEVPQGRRARGRGQGAGRPDGAAVLAQAAGQARDRHRGQPDAPGRPATQREGAQRQQQGEPPEIQRGDPGQRARPRQPECIRPVGPLAELGAEDVRPDHLHQAERLEAERIDVVPLGRVGPLGQPGEFDDREELGRRHGHRQHRREGQPRPGDAERGPPAATPPPEQESRGAQGPGPADDRRHRRPSRRAVSAGRAAPAAGAAAARSPSRPSPRTRPPGPGRRPATARPDGPPRAMKRPGRSRVEPAGSPGRDARRSPRHSRPRRSPAGTRSPDRRRAPASPARRPARGAPSRRPRRTHRSAARKPSGSQAAPTRKITLHDWNRIGAPKAYDSAARVAAVAPAPHDRISTSMAAQAIAVCATM